MYFNDRDWPLCRSSGGRGLAPFFGPNCFLRHFGRVIVRFHRSQKREMSPCFLLEPTIRRALLVFRPLTDTLQTSDGHQHWFWLLCRHCSVLSLSWWPLAVGLLGQAERGYSATEMGSRNETWAGISPDCELRRPYGGPVACFLKDFHILSESNAKHCLPDCTWLLCNQWLNC